MVALDNYAVVGEAGSGDEAIQKTLDVEPDIVLLDIRMPGKDGMATGKELAEMQSPPAVVFCTAFGEYAIEAFDVNAAGYLLKPVRRDALVHTLGKIGRVNKIQAKALGAEEDDARSRARTHISKTRRGIQLIPLSAFDFPGRSQVRHGHEKGEVLIDDVLRDLENEFSDRVIRIHRNAS